MRATAIVRTNSNGSSGAVPWSGVPSTCTRLLIGTDSGGGARLASWAISPARWRRVLAHADDAAAAYAQARAAYALERVETILVVARGDDPAVELGRGVEVVVVVIEPGALELFRLAVLQHAQRRAGLEPERRARPTPCRQHRLEVALLRTAPGRAHAEARGAVRLGGLRRGEDRVDGKQRLVFHAGVIARRLRAVPAILGAAAGLDRQQRRELHRVRVEVLPVDLVCAVQEIVERQLEELQDRLDREHGDQ